MSESDCSSGRTFDLLGDSWTLLILRESYGGVRRFEKFHELLGLPRHTLTVRLRRLTDAGVLKRVPYIERPLRHEYWPTESGLALYPVLLTLMRFGDRWLADGTERRVRVLHRRCGKACFAVVNCSVCSVELLAHRTTHRAGPGSGLQRPAPERRGRRTADPVALTHRNPSSTHRTLRLIGERWRFMIIREAFFRVRRVEDFVMRLGIPVKELARQLQKLVDDGVMRRAECADDAARFEYRLTEMGRDLSASMLAMMQWGDRWRSDSNQPLLITHLDCGEECEPVICCSECGEPMLADGMGFRTSFDDQTRDFPPVADPFTTVERSPTSRGRSA